METMSTETQDQMEMTTRPLPEHEWLHKLVGDWKVSTVMTMPGGSNENSEGTETVRMFGDLWVLGEGQGPMPNGELMQYRTGLGYDVSFKQYRGFWIANVSSHLWKYECELSEDGRTMTMNCEGPHMQKDGETARYRDVIELIDENNRTMTSYGQDDSGAWHQFMKATYRRA
jgi:hypothetical protein